MDEGLDCSGATFKIRLSRKGERHYEKTIAGREWFPQYWRLVNCYLLHFYLDNLEFGEVA
jgi:hypothetical protein